MMKNGLRRLFGIGDDPPLPRDRKAILARGKGGWRGIARLAVRAGGRSLGIRPGQARLQPFTHADVDSMGTLNTQCLSKGGN